MIRKSFLLHSFLICLALFSQYAQADIPADELQRQTMQVYASQSVGSLLLYRGEGFQEEHLAQLNGDLAALQRAVDAYPQADEELRQASRKLVGLVRQGAAFGPNEEDVPWRYSKDLAHGLLGFLKQSERFAPAADAQGELAAWQLPARIEFLSMLYLGRSYIGNLEIAREQPDKYYGQDESVLVPQVDKEIQQLSAQDAAALRKLQSRWKYLQSALSDLDSKTNSPVTLSGRPWAPITVARNARAISMQLLQISQGH